MYLLRAQKAAGYGSIKLVQMKGADSDWMGMTNKYGEAWEVPVTPKLPWDFRIVSDDGQEVSNLPPTQTCSSLPCGQPWISLCDKDSVVAEEEACEPVLYDGACGILCMADGKAHAAAHVNGQGQSGRLWMTIRF